MSGWLRDRGLTDVRLEPRSTSTLENLANAAPMVDRGPGTVAQVRAGLAARGVAVTHNTVLTMLRILEDKGRVGREPAGRAHVYRALVAREDAGTSALARLTDTVFGGSAARLMAHLARDPRLTRDEVRRLEKKQARQQRWPRGLP